MYVMALNCGSATLKYQIYDMDLKSVIVSGYAERLGLEDSFITQKYQNKEKEKKLIFMKNHIEALNTVISMIKDISMDKIVAVGHRVVQGGEKYKCSVQITDDVINTIDKLSELAPLHNPANLIGIMAAKQMLPKAKQIAVFDTAFHQTMPDFAYRYAVPSSWYKDLGVRRYGFHGTSHLYISKRAAKMLGKPAKDCNIISMHIGSGASACAIRGGLSVDSSLGMTPLSGLVMATRPGDIDPGVILYVMERLGLSPKQIQTQLNKSCGHIGITGCYADRRDITENKDKSYDCNLALQIEAHNAKKYIGGYLAELGHVDAIVFTAGVGENEWYIRKEICEGLEELGIKLDEKLNKESRACLGVDETVISTSDSKIKVMMIPTNEELVIIEDTIAIMNKTYKTNHLEMDYSFAK